MNATRPYRFLLAATLLTACSAAPGESSVEDEETDVIEGRDDDLLVVSSSIWPYKTIPVCWVNPADWLLDRMAWTRDAVEKSWQAHSALEFVGWGTCEPSSPGIRILIAEANPYSYFGTQAQGYSHTMLLNLTFNTWSAEACQANPEWCVRSIAVHEFGHAIGFDHEQNRPDAPEWCAEDAKGYGDVLIGPWDLDSVMNYCNPDWIGHGELSAGDIQGVQAIYGPPGGGGGGQPPPNQPPPADPNACGAVTYQGECHGSTVVYCEDGLKSIDCSALGMVCGWDSKWGFYNCI